MPNLDNLVLYDALRISCEMFHPTSYLEIGVCEGSSLKEVLKAAPNMSDIYLCDTWGGAYGGTNRGSGKHLSPLLSDFHGKIHWLDGDSKATLPPLHGKVEVDMALVDADHSAVGAKADLENALPLIKTGGVLIMDDLDHPSHAYLKEVWREFVTIRNLAALALNVTGIALVCPKRI